MSYLNMAQAMRAVLLASATAATFGWRLSARLVRVSRIFDGFTPVFDHII